ncbi:MAG: hypothetical protein RSC76_10735, partial [Oscillospiraceae bacterium]
MKEIKIKKYKGSLILKLAIVASLIFVVVTLVHKWQWMQTFGRWGLVLCGAYIIYVAQITLVAGHSSNIFSFE